MQVTKKIAVKMMIGLLAAAVGFVLLTNGDKIRTCLHKVCARLCGNLSPLTASKSLEIRKVFLRIFSVVIAFR